MQVPVMDTAEKAIEAIAAIYRCHCLAAMSMVEVFAGIVDIVPTPQTLVLAMMAGLA